MFLPGIVIVDPLLIVLQTIWSSFHIKLEEIDMSQTERLFAAIYMTIEDVSIIPTADVTLTLNFIFLYPLS
jgi:hypothetical protein